MSRRSLIYAAFDRFPAPKGAATHIAAFVDALSTEFTDVDLVTVAGVPSLARREHNGFARPHVRHTQLPALGPTLIERVLSFRTQLRGWWRDRRPDVAHVRSIFEGYPIAREKTRWCRKLIFEVNGLPSIELKYHYPQVADDRELMRKLISQEQCCLEAADLVITVSEVNAAHLRQRGVNPAKLRVIPNGVDPDVFEYRPPRPIGDLPLRLLYAGTLSSWQGVHVAIEALALYCRDAPARLQIVGDGRAEQVRNLQELAHRHGVGEFVQIAPGMSQPELAASHHVSDVILAPLMPNDRNLIQGCCPLKVLEAMASGTPLVASDLPVVSALARHELDALLVRPGSAKGIKDALIRFRTDRDLAMRCSHNARARVEHEFTWEHARQKLLDSYDNVLSGALTQGD